LAHTQTGRAPVRVRLDQNRAPARVPDRGRRLAWWREHGDQAVEVYKAAKKRREREAETGQANMFD